MGNPRSPAPRSCRSDNARTPTPDVLANMTDKKGTAEWRACSPKKSPKRETPSRFRKVCGERDPKNHYPSLLDKDQNDSQPPLVSDKESSCSPNPSEEWNSEMSLADIRKFFKQE